MTWILPAEDLEPRHRGLAGGKAMALAEMARQGLRVPRTLCLLTTAYDAFVDRSGLRERILRELNRKDFQTMRWEEVWDCASRIRHLFLRHPLPDDLAAALATAVQEAFGAAPLAVRSSAVDEDSRGHSFAGLHESHVNVRGAAAVGERVRQVWASLWSDAALLYRREIGLTAEDSAMAVVLQETVAGESSGVLFTRSPADPRHAVLEAVHGLNQGLVDGSLSPDRWTLERDSGRILRHEPARRIHRLRTADGGGLQLEPLAELEAARPPLEALEVEEVFRVGRRLEKIFQGPQDVEWTLAGGVLVILQARPVTAAAEAGATDQRAWYLSLRRSFDNLQALRAKIEDQLIPEMARVAAELQRQDPARLADSDLAAEIRRRRGLNTHWVNVYWTEFIPYAHGMRLFGRVYNDTLRPEDPYEFVDLLAGAPLLSRERNRLLGEMAARLRKAPGMAAHLQDGRHDRLPAAFRALLEEFIRSFGDLSCSVSGAVGCDPTGGALLPVLLEMAAHPQPEGTPRGREASRNLEARFLDRFAGAEREWARELLELGRSSYRLRDDDNIHLARIEAGLVAAVQEGYRRLETPRGGADPATEAVLREALAEETAGPPATGAKAAPAAATGSLRYRQLLGQPAGPGVARGRARVVAKHADLAGFKKGEILVCDAVDPNMTFVVPLAAGIVERRGGMLIHGAIIAREYGLPCVTGVPAAAERIRTGETVTVDGYLGIVTLD